MEPENTMNEEKVRARRALFRFCVGGAAGIAAGLVATPVVFATGTATGSVAGCAVVLSTLYGLIGGTLAASTTP